MSEVHRAAIIAARTGQTGEAERYFRDLLRHFPRFADGHYDFGVFLQGQGRNAEAEACYRQALECQAGHRNAHLNLASLLAARGDADAAIETLRALPASDDDPAALTGLGIAYAHLGRRGEAIAALRAAWRLQPERVPVALTLARLLHESGDSVESRAMFDQALAQAAVQPAESILAFGRQCLAEGYPDAAHAFFRLAQGRDGDGVAVRQALFNTDPRWNQPLPGRSVRLERWSAAHVDFIWGCLNHQAFLARVGRHWQRPATRDALLAILRQREAMTAEEINGMDWVILSRRGAVWRPVGVIGLADLAYGHGRAEYYIGFPDEAPGLTRAAVEASLLLLEFAFNVIGLEKVTALIYGDNPYAQQNIESLGFVREGVLRQHIAIHPGGPRMDVIANACLAGDMRGNARLVRLSRKLLGRDITLPLAV